MEKAFEWLRKGSKRVRLLKIGTLAALLYWSIHFVSTQFKVAEAVTALVIYYTLILWARQRRRHILKASGIEEFDELSDDESLFRTRSHLESLGWSIVSTPRDDGMGADFVAVDNGGLTSVVGLRKAKGEVGTEGVQAVSAAVRHYGANNGLLITNGFLSDAARQLAASNGVNVWDREVFAHSLVKTKDPQ